MKIGDTVRIKECGPILELVGESAEVVDLQIQQCERYRAYPIWAKMTSGERRGNIYGFREDEVELLPEGVGARDTGTEEEVKAGKATVIEQVEEILKGVASMDEIAEIETIVQKAGIRVGDTVRVRECDTLPELMGESAEVVDSQIQQHEKYRVYPIWAKMTTGERRGKIYGFREDEVELLPKGGEVQGAVTRGKVKINKMKVIEQVEEILKGMTTVNDIADIEGIIQEAKGKISGERTKGFWDGKTPCWEMFRCPEAMRNECPAFKNQSLPCWEIEGTYTKLYDYGQKGDATDICQHCRVYKRWGQGKPIEIKLFGKGADTISKVGEG